MDTAEKVLFFHFFKCTLLNIKHKQTHKKIIDEKTSTFCVLSYRHDNFPCAGMLIFTVRIIFFGVLRKCYKITVSHSSFYLEFPYSFWQIFPPCNVTKITKKSPHVHVNNVWPGHETPVHFKWSVNGLLGRLLCSHLKGVTPNHGKFD